MPILGIGKKKKNEKKRKVGGPVGTVAVRQSSVGSVGVHPAQLEEEERKARLAHASGSDGSEEKVTVDVPVLCRAEAICAYEPDDFEVDADITFLRFETGQQIDVIEQDESGWWEGIIEGVAGIFPGAYVRVVEIYGAEEGGEQPKASATVPCEAVDLNNSSSTDADPDLHEKKLRSPASLARGRPPTAPEETLEDAELARLAAAGAFGEPAREPSEDLPPLEGMSAKEESSEDSDPMEPQHPAPEPPLADTETTPSHGRNFRVAPAAGGVEQREASVSRSTHSGAVAAVALATSPSDTKRELGQHASTLERKVEEQEQAIKKLLARAERAEREASSLRASLGEMKCELESSKSSIVAAHSMEQELAAATSELERLRAEQAQSEQARAESQANAEELLATLTQERAAMEELKQELARKMQHLPTAGAVEEELHRAKAAAAVVQRDLFSARAELEEQRDGFRKELERRHQRINHLASEARAIKEELKLERQLRMKAEGLAEDRKRTLQAAEAAAAEAAVAEAAVAEAAAAAPVHARTVGEKQPVLQQLVEQPPVVPQPVVQQPVLLPPVAQQPVQQPVAQQPAQPVVFQQPAVVRVPAPQPPSSATATAAAVAAQPERAAPRTIKVIRGRVLRRPAPTRAQSSVPQAIASRPLPPPPQ